VIGSDKRARTAAKRGYLNLQDNHRTSTSYKSIAELVSPMGLNADFSMYQSGKSILSVPFKLSVKALNPLNRLNAIKIVPLIYLIGT
jgi:hypothetical protein